MAEQKLDFAVVEISDGILRGKKVVSDRGKTYMSFQGIPYGKAPVGELRFKVKFLTNYSYCDCDS